MSPHSGKVGSEDTSPNTKWLTRAILSFLGGVILTGSTMWFGVMNPAFQRITELATEVARVKTEALAQTIQFNGKLDALNYKVDTISMALMYQPGSAERAAILLRLNVPDRTK